MRIFQWPTTTQCKVFSKRALYASSASLLLAGVASLKFGESHLKEDPNYSFISSLTAKVFTISLAICCLISSGYAFFCYQNEQEQEQSLNDVARQDSLTV